MAFHNVPPNGFPDLPDVEELEAVVKDVTGLKAELDTVKSGLIKFVAKTITTTNGIGQIPDLNTTNHIVVSVKTTGATVMYWDGANTNWYVTLVNPSDLSIVSTERTQTYIIGYVDV